ncbi:MAG TPA: NAD(P)H-hydrate dehydratase [Methylibium sp.]|nr:NAD(P)H-hydrate dehydratase [Methylibium sp.]
MPPVPIAPGRSGPPQGWPLHGVAASRRLEAAAAQGLPAHTLMRRAGWAVARLALALAPAAHRVWVAAGPGNNGGDGLEAAMHLHAAGKDVTVTLLGATSRPPDAVAALERARAAGIRVIDGALPPWALQPQDLAIDALFGIGMSRPPGGAAGDAVRALNGAVAPVLAIDLPSGLDADHGWCLDPAAAVQARWTLSLLTLKPGLFTAAGRDHAGEVWFDDLAVAADAEPPVAQLLTSVDGWWPRRRHAQHKGSFGDLWVIGGSAGMTGAAALAARAALAAGAGRVYLVSHAGADPAQPELMQRSAAALTDHDELLEQATVVAGCGGGPDIAAPLSTLIGRAGRLLLDADALNALAADTALAARLRARQRRGRPTLLTPHPLEAARLLGVATADIQADRIGAARALAERLSAVVVLKGAGSVIADGAGHCMINASGNAALATAGAGDVLAGWIGGLWSQGLTVQRAAALGVFSHGAAADRWMALHGRAAPLPAGRLIDGLADDWGRHDT